MFRSTGVGGFIPPQKRGFFVVVIFALLVKTGLKKEGQIQSISLLAPHLVVL